jgi:hypothetical protein
VERVEMVIAGPLGAEVLDELLGRPWRRVGGGVDHRSVPKQTNARVEFTSARAGCGQAWPRSGEATPAAKTSIRLPGVQVGRDLGTEVDHLEFGLDPRHRRLSLFLGMVPG